MIVNTGSVGKVFAALILAALAVIPNTASAQSTYLLIDSIAGGSIDNLHTGWINVLHLDYGVQAPTALTRTATFLPIKITKEMDVATIPIMEAAASGRVFSTATVDVTMATQSGRVPFYRIVMRNVRVMSYSVDIQGQEGSSPTESFELQYGELSLTYSDLDRNGQVKGNIEYTFKVPADQ